MSVDKFTNSWVLLPSAYQWQEFWEALTDGMMRCDDGDGPKGNEYSKNIPDISLFFVVKE